MKRPLISIIVPVFNTVNYLEKCVSSIICQSYTNLEIVLVDDGSNDGSGDLCEKLSLIDERIKVIHKENGGQLSARKLGAKIAKGDYIIGVDSDDWIDETRIANIVEKGMQGDPDMVYVDGIIRENESGQKREVYFEEATVLQYQGEEIEGEFLKFLIGDSFFLDRKIALSHCWACVKKDIYIDNIMCIDEGIRRTEDAITILSCVLACDKIVIMSDPSYHYTQRPGSINARTTNWEDDHARRYYIQLGKIKQKYMNRMNDLLRKVFVQFAYYNLFLTNYRTIYNFYLGRLFPYDNVRDGDSVIVYGAGNIGVEIVNAIDSDKRFHIVAWVDKYVRNNPRSNHVIESTDVIIEKEYDYVLIAILQSRVAKEIKKNVIDMGVSEDKIKLMRCECMRDEDLKRIFA